MKKLISIIVFAFALSVSYGQLTVKIPGSGGSGGSGGGSGLNIYNSDSTLAGDRTISGAGHNFTLADANNINLYGTSDAFNSTQVYSEDLAGNQYDG